MLNSGTPIASTRVRHAPDARDGVKEGVMRRNEKRRFIQSLCSSVAKAAQGAVSQMPAEWDGFELRELLAELFDDERMAQMRKGSRARSYQKARYNIGRI